MSTEQIKNEAARTEHELLTVKDSKTVPLETTATGQPLTPYHSLLYSLLSWERPRATAVSYASVVLFIFATRYLPLLRWAFKFLYMALGFTAALEILGRFFMSQGLASSFRPRKYYTIPKDTIEGLLEDLEQLMDFFLIEFQRVLFAENIIHTVAGFFSAFTAYWLSKILPFWVLSLFAVSVAYLGPLFYINNRELVDTQIENVHQLVDNQTHHVKEMAGQHTAHATDLVKQYYGEYSSKAHNYIGNATRRSSSPEMTKVSPPAVKIEPAAEPVVEPAVAPDSEPIAEPVQSIEHSDFPEAPKAEPIGESAPETETKVEPEPLLA